MEYERKNIPDNHDHDIINYKQFLEWKYKTPEEIKKKICDIVEPGNPGNNSKFKKQFDETRKRIRCDRLVQNYNLKIENAFDYEKLISMTKETKDQLKFTDLVEDKGDDDKQYKFTRIFKHAYYKIILSFYDTMIALRKAKREFAIIFRFFGHNVDEIHEFIYEFNHFCNGTHPMYSGDFGLKIKFDGSKGTKDYRISMDKFDNISVCFRNEDEKKECCVFETLEIVNSLNFSQKKKNMKEKLKNFTKEIIFP